MLVMGRRPTTELHHLCKSDDGAMVGVFNISEIIRGPLQSGYLGYYAFSPHAAQGYMREGMGLVLRQAFLRYKLHRLEANIQPGNEASIRLARSAGFHKEGFSPRYLKINGRWCDHERWALLADDWRARL
jgi:ribosomal-protein-alanine N-acetyltransferase